MGLDESTEEALVREHNEDVLSIGRARPASPRPASRPQ